MEEMKTKLRRRANTNFDSGSVDYSYNDPAGAIKVVPAGPFLRPLDSSTLTCDASTKTKMSLRGVMLAIYNNDTSVHSITIGDSTITALGAGVIGGTFVGIPCVPNQYTYVNTYIYDYIITDSNKLLVFIVEDDTKMIRQ
jgi:hypothetical protein